MALSIRLSLSTPKKPNLPLKALARVCKTSIFVWNTLEGVDDYSVLLHFGFFPHGFQGWLLLPLTQQSIASYCAHFAIMLEKTPRTFVLQLDYHINVIYLYCWYIYLTISLRILNYTSKWLEKYHGNTFSLQKYWQKTGSVKKGKKLKIN